MAAPFRRFPPLPELHEVRLGNPLGRLLARDARSAALARAAFPGGEVRVACGTRLLQGCTHAPA
jgi:hypothetical protein